MDAREWLGLQPTHNPMRWVLPGHPRHLRRGRLPVRRVRPGAAIAALEGVTGRPVIWATAQYLSYAKPPSMLDVDVTVAADGRHITQARATGHVVDTEIVTVNAALGERPFESSGSWVEPPDVPGPEECDPRSLRSRAPSRS